MYIYIYSIYLKNKKMYIIMKNIYPERTQKYTIKKDQESFKKCTLFEVKKNPKNLTVKQLNSFKNKI